MCSSDLGKILAGLGKEWMIEGNGYKPYACGVVLHPLIDAMIAVSKKAKTPAGSIARIEVQVHPDVIRITGIDQPGTGLMSKFSANHAASVAYIDQAAGIAQFSNERSADQGVQELRKQITIKPVASFRLDQAAATVWTKSGTKFDSEIEHATGTVANPMLDTALSEKFLGNAAPILGESRAKALVNKIWELETLSDIGEIVRATA